MQRIDVQFERSGYEGGDAFDVLIDGAQDNAAPQLVHEGTTRHPGYGLGSYGLTPYGRAIRHSGWEEEFYGEESYGQPRNWRRWSSREVYFGVHAVTVRVRDAAGNVGGESDAVELMINTAPDAPQGFARGAFAEGQQAFDLLPPRQFVE